MKTRNDLYAFQKTAVNHIAMNPGSMAWMDVGLGKTVVALTAIDYWLDRFMARAALVVGTVKIIEAVWMQEIQEWAHLQHLTCSLVRGTEAERLKALQDPADIYLINYEMLIWLQKALELMWNEYRTPPPFDIVIFDEISKMKNATSKRTRAFAKVLPFFKYRVGLTGTPATNGYMDLHGQYLMLDGGMRLGPNKTTYQERWFIQNPYNRKIQPRRNATKEIRNAIADITLEMSQEDYLDIPPLKTVDMHLALPEEVMEVYREFEQELFMFIGESEVEAFNEAAKSTKCRQLANGAVFLTDDGNATRNWNIFHDVKLDALEELIESLNGEPLLVCYQFIHDKERLAKRFKNAVFLDRGTNTAEAVGRWNRGEIPLLVGHPASMGHGLNLQHGGHHICWFGLPWNLEHYQQAIGRLKRQGQKHPVIYNHRLLAKGTIEAVVASALETKNATQVGLRYAVKMYRDQMMLKN